MFLTSQDPTERLASVKEFGEHGGVNSSIEVSTTFTVLKADTLPAIFNGETGPAKGCYVYGRSFSPTVIAFGKQIAALENTEAAYATSSGMAAISCALLALCNTGDHIVASNTVYGGTFALLKSFLPVKCGISTTFVDITDVAAVKAAMQPNTKVVYTESMSNPTLVVAPLDQLADVAHAAGAKLVVDNTFTPCIMTPKNWGADVIVHSMTKFVSGASDIIAGCVCGTRDFISSLMHFHSGPLMLLGPTMDPRIASELTLRLPHLGLRMQEHSRRAQAFAERLQKKGATVTYPGLPAHPQYQLLTRLANPGYGYGGLLGLDLGSKAAADAFMERLQNKHSFGFMAVSLGYFDTLMSVSAASTSSELEPEEMAASGIRTGYVRMSVGITGSLEQRWTQLEESYNFIMKGGAQAPYRAVKMVSQIEGGQGSLLTWPSLGSETCLDELDELVAGVDAAAPAVAAASGGTATCSSGDAAVLPTSSVCSDGLPAAGAGGTEAATSPFKPIADTGFAGAVSEAAAAVQGSGRKLAHAPSSGKIKVRRLADGVDVMYHPVNPGL